MLLDCSIALTKTANRIVAIADRIVAIADRIVAIPIVFNQSQLYPALYILFNAVF